MREARVCYNYLAGEAGAVLLTGLILRNYLLVSGQGDLQLTDLGRAFFDTFGVGVDGLENMRRPLCLHCLNWSERRHRLGGALGAAVLAGMLEHNWLRRTDGRALIFTPAGRQEFNSHFSCN